MINALVVDDEKLVRKGFIAMANWQAYNIHFIGEAKDGNSALSMLGKHEVDLLFVDISMPGMSGFELMEQVRIRYPQIKSVVLTCHHEFDYVQEALRLGAIDYIVKTLLNRNNVDETISRILKRLTWETRDSAVPSAPAAARSFPGAAAFCAFGCKGQQPPLLDLLPTSIRPSALGDSLWLHVMGNAETADWMKELPAEIMEHWQPVHISGSSNISMSEAKTAISQRLREYLFYWPKGEAPSVVSLEDVWAENRPEASKDEAEALCRELENMRWSLFGKDWKRLMDRIEEGWPAPDCLLASAVQIAEDWRHYFEWDADSTERWMPARKPRSWKQAKSWLSDMAADIQRRMVEMALSREVALCLLQAMVYMKRNACTDLNQNAVAYHVGMSRSYFSQCYKRFTGMSFGEALRKMRIEHAKELLALSDLSVYEIASRIGFEDDKHFSRVFRERVGLYPTEFRTNSAARG
ncbi:response regulator [Cohnella cholangitidis]|uniref:Response regulator n=1 Tax=Cohnella cholangitidis TaxID=2598458 RepID=A0A7G5C4Y8_9BACL|nr:response regulator [Cohnella cholangitidis]QMV44272.1 response regulator [Cohnella cholangitidis]